MDVSVKIVEARERRLDLSRRNFIYGLAAGASALTTRANTARAQQDVWRELRRDDLGFRIDMPGVPETETAEDTSNNVWKRTFDAQVTFEQTIFGIQYTEFKNVLSAEDEFRTFRQGLRLAGIPISREIPLEVSGFPGHDFI